jgi:hypothetical protein
VTQPRHPAPAVRWAVACIVLAIVLALPQPDAAGAALTVTAHPRTVLPGSDVTIRTSSSARCLMVVERSDAGPVTHRQWFSGGTGSVHVIASAAIGLRLVDVTCDRRHARTRFWVDDGYEPSGEENNRDPGRESSGTLGGANFANARLADLALSKVGQRAGPCRQAVIDWARTVSGGSVRLGGAYLADLRSNGGVEVDRDAARKGDIIQLYDPAQPDAFTRGMHTAVVVTHLGRSSAFDVVDSNFDGTQTVEHHYWNPYATAKRYHLKVSIWRLGTVRGRHRATSLRGSSTTTDVPVQRFRIKVGCRPSGCGLIVRAWPGRRFRQIGVLYDAQTAPIMCQTTGELLRGPTGDLSNVWDGLSTGGYVPDLYVDIPGAGSFSPSIPHCGTTPAAPSPPPPPPPSPLPAATYAETSGGVLHTWSSYVDAGGIQGPSVAPQATIQIACKVVGFQVADGNTWWYRIASSPWGGVFYASADGFYNNGEVSGSLLGTPFVDPAVQDC